jgi:hypothetical protein
MSWRIHQDIAKPMSFRKGDDMRTLILAICLAATPAAAQVIIETPNSEKHDRNDRDRDREHPNLREDRRQDFRDERRDNDNDDEPDVTMARYSWPHNCCHYGR